MIELLENQAFEMNIKVNALHAQYVAKARELGELRRRINELRSVLKPPKP